ncbi:Helix-turn-helix domain-containing protein [Paenibacillus sp. UNCCL117]|uniref:helix-turn-helix domain-containing protein n=1 Tax=unclassified Paenibacillus TaxID=185978 RepID=UPI00088DA3BD|nr:MULTISPECIES: AraC family transcriptional regulator [unclassified Paenibacillus]SDE20002.1 Helix-turn-helix domain-containing protein [Paenibacillus sp. cl123]SFW61884.1 Helix-turn-helix domain-containing protein [Paenibacillus sp. UNCCL117]
MIYYAVYNIAQELAGSFSGITVFTGEKLDLHLLINYRRDLTVNVHEFFRLFTADLQSKVRNYLKIEIYMVYSYEFQSMGQIGRALEELRLYNRELYYDTDSIGIMTQRHGRSEYHEVAQQEGLKEKLFRAFHEKDMAALSHMIDKYAKQSAADKISPTSFIAQLSQWVRLLEYDSGYDKECNIFHSNLESTMRQQETLKCVLERISAILRESIPDEDEGIDRQKLKAIDRYISEHLSENISLVSIANHLYLNPSYFSRYFKKMTGINFTDYVDRHKMNIALEMIKDKEMSVEMIAAMLGYSDRTYFSKVFKKYNGISPVDYKGKSGRS